MKLTLIKLQDQFATYHFSKHTLANEHWQGELHIGAGQGAYGTGCVAILLGAFDKWSRLDKQLYVRKQDGEWYWSSAATDSTAKPITRDEDTKECLCTFFDTVYHTWLNDILMETSAAPDGA